jgi:RNA polymerase sigma-70 factor, ECF subfamily
MPKRVMVPKDDGAKITTTVTRTTGLDEVVRAAQHGDGQAWAELVSRFQAQAVAAALGWTGRWDTAADLAQDAFQSAYLHLGELREPQVFASWFGRLVRTACSRSTRVRSVPLADLTGPVELPCGPESDPARPVVASEEAAAVRGAVEALPPPERIVVTLFYLAGMSYPQIAEFLGISVPAAKKRAVTARRRLNEMMEMTSTAPSGARPSQTGELRGTVLLFSAIHGGAFVP